MSLSRHLAMSLSAHPKRVHTRHAFPAEPGTAAMGYAGAMTPETFTAALLFALVMAVTPGPNNAMLASSGATFGLKPPLPHLAGVCIGFAVMVQMVGLGLAAVLLASPMLQLA